MATINFRVALQGKQEDKPEVALFAYSRGGRFIAATPLKDGNAELSLPTERIGNVRLFVAPGSFLQEKAPSIETLERAGAYEPAWRYNARAKIQELPPITEAIWRLWPICACRVKGRIVQTCADGVDHPVPHAIVHICEVDALPRIILRLPDDILFRLRDELLKKLELVPIRFPIPEPDPEPFLPEIMQVDIKRVAKIADAAPLAIPLAMESRVALSAGSAVALRSTLLKQVELIRPYLCYWPWLWHWFHCDELRVIETNANGVFDTTIFYNCLGDHPDLYFWVEYPIEGSLVTVYRPTVPCHTHWNYTCGSEITIRLSDARIPCVAPDPELSGQTVLIRQIGAIDTTQVANDGRLAASGGGASGGAAFGGSLEPVVNFAAEGLAAAGITHYRWSYRRLTRGDGTTPVADTWHRMKSAVSKRFVQFLPGMAFQYVSVPLGPDATAHPELELFKIPPSIPTDLNPANIGWGWLDGRNDRASAYFPSATADKAGEAEVAGLFALKLELFKADGTLAALPRGSFAVESGVLLPSMAGADQTALENGTAVLPSMSRMVELTAGQETAFVVMLRVDNCPTEADIHGVFILGDSASHDCGMLPFGTDTSKQVRLSFAARHPHGFATCALHTYKGRMGEVVSGSPATAFASTSGWVNGPGAGAMSNGFARDGGADIHKDVSVHALLSANAIVCPSAAFALRLDVWSQITDGYSRVGRDSYDGEAFALIP